MAAFTGAGQYDIVEDPSESRDLRDQQPARYRAMLADYREYAQSNGVLEMPVDYNYVNQVLRYTAVEILKRQAPYLAGGLILLITLVLGLRWRIRLRQRWVKKRG